MKENNEKKEINKRCIFTAFIFTFDRNSFHPLRSSILKEGKCQINLPSISNFFNNKFHHKLPFLFPSLLVSFHFSSTFPLFYTLLERKVFRLTSEEMYGLVTFFTTETFPIFNMGKLWFWLLNMVIMDIYYFSFIVIWNLLLLRSSYESHRKNKHFLLIY